MFVKELSTESWEKTERKQQTRGRASSLDAGDINYDAYL